MPAINTVVTDYRIRALANGSVYTIQVECYRHGQLVGYLFFEQNRSVAEASVGNGNRIILRYPVELFSPIMDMLRQESPIVMGVNGNHNSGSIGTFAEGVGEEESA